MLVDVGALERDYYARRPDLDDPDQLVAFGTSGHRGSPLRGSFTEAHILATTQAICDYRRGRGIDGPLYMGKDTHAVSGPAERTALEVLAANGVETIIQSDDGVTPTPVICRKLTVAPDKVSPVALSLMMPETVNFSFGCAFVKKGTNMSERIVSCLSCFIVMFKRLELRFLLIR